MGEEECTKEEEEESKAQAKTSYWRCAKATSLGPVNFKCLLVCSLQAGFSSNTSAPYEYCAE